MATSIISILASGVAWFAAKGLDSLLGKWLAYFIIAFEERASDKAKAAFSESLNAIKANAPEKAQAWADWRKRVG